MKKKVKALMCWLIILVVISFGIVLIGKVLHEQRQECEQVYQMLEKDSLTTEEREYIKSRCDVDEYKEFAVPLRGRAAERYEYHFGRKP